jgi:hypothetical protein
MGRDLHYEPGSFYRVDDRTGFPTRAGRTRREWTGLIVGDQFWEARQPQDLVKGVPDLQFVPEPRPLAPNVTVGPQWIEITAAAAVGATTLVVESLQGLNVGTPIAVMTALGENFFTKVASLGNGFITIVAPLPAAVPADNLLQVLTERIPVPTADPKSQ